MESLDKMRISLSYFIELVDRVDEKKCPHFWGQLFLEDLKLEFDLQFTDQGNETLLDELTITSNGQLVLLTEQESLMFFDIIAQQAIKLTQQETRETKKIEGFVLWPAHRYCLDLLHSPKFTG